MNNFTLIFNFILSEIRSIWGLYSTNLILSSVIGLFILGKAIKLNIKVKLFINP